MRFKTNKTTTESDDAEGASDIISQEENNIGYVGSVLPTPEWNDPWSSDPWNDVSWGDAAAPVASIAPSITTNQNQNHVESSFESLQFRPVLKTTGDNNDFLDASDAFGVTFGPVATAMAAAAAAASTRLDPNINSNNSPTSTMKRSNQATASPNIINETRINVHVVLKERLSILFDDTTKDPICKVVGSIYVKPTKRKIGSFCLTVRDKRAHIEHWDEQNSRCRNITASVPHLALDPGDQVFLISLNREHQQQDRGLEAPIVSYTCIPRLRPMPMVSTLYLLNETKRTMISTRTSISYRFTGWRSSLSRFNFF